MLTSGMVDIMDIHKDMEIMDMPLPHRTLTCIMEVILAMEITSNPSSNSSSKWAIAEKFLVYL
uniref:Uncharacterized protein n=1 Tax=Rhizophora mucronata TaxID=61149 RepID=A0A2P2NJF1_RHIMU